MAEAEKQIIALLKDGRIDWKNSQLGSAAERELDELLEKLAKEWSPKDE